MHEFVAALTVQWCALTYWLGGQEIPWTKRGYKVFRRFVMPAGLFVGLVLLGAVWWKAALACALLSAACHLGYGTDLWRLPLTGAAMVAGALVLYWPAIPPWWAGIPITYHLAYGWISRKYNSFLWAYVALLMGTGLGIVYTSALN